MEREEIANKRKIIFSSATKYIHVNKGDRRVYSPRVCSICGRSLSSLIARTGSYVTSVPHVHFHLDNNNIIKIDICQDINSCYRNKNIKEVKSNVYDR